MQTVELQVFEFRELSAAAKEKVCDRHRDAFDMSDLDFTLDDIDNAARLLGIEIQKYDNYRAHGNPCIFFNGLDEHNRLWFKGFYQHRADSFEKICEEFPKDDELNRIALELHKAAAMRSPYCAGFFIGERHNEVRVEFAADDCGWSEAAMKQYADEVESLIRDFAVWAHERLRDEYEYQRREETIAESCKANELLFTEDGEVWRG